MIVDVGSASPDARTGGLIACDESDDPGKLRGGLITGGGSAGADGLRGGLIACDESSDPDAIRGLIAGGGSCDPDAPRGLIACDESSDPDALRGLIAGGGSAGPDGIRGGLIVFGLGRSETKLGAKSSGPNMSLLNGMMPVALKPEVILAGVMAFSNARLTKAGIS